MVLVFLAGAVQAALMVATSVGVSVIGASAVVARGRRRGARAVPCHDAARATVFFLPIEGHQPGGDLEVAWPGSSDVLVGHHDGLYWVERSSGHDA